MIACTACNHLNPHGSSFCESCGAELHDPRLAEQQADEVEAEFRLDQVKKARGALLIVGVLQTIAAALIAAAAPTGLDMAIFVFAGLVAVVFFALAWWCKRQPFAAAIVGLFVYSGLHLADAIADPSVIYRGIILKVIIVVVLVRAVRAGFAHREFVRSRGIG